MLATCTAKWNMEPATTTYHYPLLNRPSSLSVNARQQQLPSELQSQLVLPPTLIRLDEEGRLELGSDDTDSPATSNSPRESLRGGTLLGLELRRSLDGVDLDTVTLSMGNIEGFNNAPISIDEGELLSSYHFNRKDWSRVLTTVTSWQYRMTCTINNKEKDNSNNKQEGKQQ